MQVEKATIVKELSDLKEAWLVEGSMSIDIEKTDKAAHLLKRIQVGKCCGMVLTDTYRSI